MSSSDSGVWIYVGTAAAILLSMAYFSSKPKRTKETIKNGAISSTEKSPECPSATESSGSEASTYPGGKVSIFFGSQTGTAEGFAQVLVDEGKEQGFDASLMDLEDYEPEMLKDSSAIFLMATYGEGEPTDNAAEFTKWIRGKQDELEDDQFENLKFTVFGLGNRQYEQYNAMGRLVNKKLAKYGGQCIYEYGEGDDDGTLEEDFEGWKEGLWPQFRKALIGDDAADAVAVSSSKTRAPHIAFRCVAVKAGDVSEEHGKVAGAAFEHSMIQHSTSHYFDAPSVKIIAHRELRKSTADGSTIHLEFDLSNTDISYVTADNLAILAENATDMVERTAKLLGYKLSDWFKLEAIEENHRFPFPTPCSIKYALANYVDLGHAPRRNVIAHLAHFATDEDEQDRLLYLSSKEGVDEYHAWVTDSQRTLVDVLEAFPSIQIPLESFFHIIPSLQPRYYTISSSSEVHPQRVHATVSVIRESLKDGREFRGICSTYLSEKTLPQARSPSSRKARPSHPGEQGKKTVREWPSTRAFIRASTFRLPNDPTRPIIMVGPGTGIAPMRAFLQSRNYQREAGVSVGKTILYFGCRNREQDFIYEDELMEYKENGTLTELHTAFSREQKQKVYVQHLLEKQGEAVWKLLSEESAHVYVCGATSMGNDVHHVMEKILVQHGGQTKEQASAYLRKLQENSRYIQELWA